MNNYFYNICPRTQNAERASYYAVFDGHAGVDAATYAVSHLHCHLAASKHYPERPAEAMLDAYTITDADFLQKCRKQKLSAGTTALSVLYRPVEGRLYVGWLGDSKALLVTQGTIMQLVQPHKPEMPVGFADLSTVSLKEAIQMFLFVIA